MRQSVRLMRLEKRGGKQRALNRIVRETFCSFTDAIAILAQIA